MLKINQKMSFFGVLNYRQTVVAKHFIQDIRPLIVALPGYRATESFRYLRGYFSRPVRWDNFFYCFLQRAFTIMANKVNLLFRC
ncbi:hypothetical protein APT80_10155 [Klebsiella pneumoniae]|nr:hypothetical protein AB187_00520 [Klebsiella pneumoniae]AKR86856.1 hypothetical protein H218_28615 [Klebsiella pneumoniae DMC1097]KEF64532.1 hypothetical protein Y972_27290 [Klebsiella pneumoniae UHKPC45]KLA43229.1 hypothetical protein WB36_00730 [Klebsiella pneumoniae subsp. pneumoniae]KSX20096.1 hypothetical protein APT80_10155 [Klebsiella pneumoniae]